MASTKSQEFFQDSSESVSPIYHFTKVGESDDLTMSRSEARGSGKVSSDGKMRHAIKLEAVGTFVASAFSGARQWRWGEGVGVGIERDETSCRICRISGWSTEDQHECMKSSESRHAR